MYEKTERVYNVFSWWFIVWYFLYINNIITANPFIAAAIASMWDVFAVYYITNDNTNIKSTSLNGQIVIYFRIFVNFFY